MKTKANRFDLEDRLVDFTVLVLRIESQLPKNRVGNQLGQQLVRCGTSFSLNYAEAQSGE